MEYKDDLSVTTWLDLGAPILATPTADGLIGSHLQRFYRAVLLP